MQGFHHPGLIYWITPRHSMEARGGCLTKWWILHGHVFLSHNQKWPNSFGQRRRKELPQSKECQTGKIQNLFFNRCWDRHPLQGCLRLPYTALSQPIPPASHVQQHSNSRLLCLSALTTLPSFLSSSCFFQTLKSLDVTCLAANFVCCLKWFLFLLSIRLPDWGGWKRKMFLLGLHFFQQNMQVFCSLLRQSQFAWAPPSVWVYLCCTEDTGILSGVRNARQISQALCCGINLLLFLW